MELEQVVVRLVADTSQYMRQLDYAGSRLVGFSAGVVAAVAHHGVVLAAEYEKTAVAFATMTKDAAVGKKLIEDLTDMAIKTPFKSNELLANAKQLAAFGFEVENITNILDVLGNVSSGTNTPLDRIVLAFGQVRVAGKLMGTELRQFVDAGIPIIEELAKVMDKPVSEIRSLVEQGHVGFDLVSKAFDNMTKSGGLFSGLMSRINRDTVAGQWQSLSENLEVSARNMTLAAFQGLRLRNILESMSNLVTPGSKGPQEGVIEFFRNVRTVLDAIWLTGEKVWKFISGIATTVGQWADRNKELVNSVLILVAALLAVKTAAFAFIQVVVILRTVYAAIQAIISLTIVWRALMIAFNAGLAVSSGIAWIMSLGPLLLIIIPLLLLIGAIVANMSFDRFGESFKGAFKELGQVAKDTFKGLKDAINAGDIDLAFDILIGGLEIGFKRLMLSLKVEWTMLLLDFKQGLGRFAASTLNWLGQTVNIKGEIKPAKDQVEFDEAGAKRERDALRNSMQFNATNDQGIKALVDAQNARIAQAGVKAADASRASWIEEHSGEISEVRREMIAEMERLKAKGLLGLFNVDGTIDRNKFGKPGQEGFVLDENMRGLFKKQLEWAEKNRNTFGQGKLALPNPFDQAFASDMIIKQIGVQFGFSGGARDAANKLSKEMDKGRSGIEVFGNHMKFLTEAANVPRAAEEFGAVLGMAGATSPLGSRKQLEALIDRQKFQVGQFDAFQDLKKAVGSMEGKDKFAPGLAFGTTAAMDAINANRDQTVDAQAEILATLIEAKEIQKQQRDYEKRIAEGFDALRANGQLEQFDLNFIGPAQPR